jgi:hypothetical protein
MVRLAITASVFPRNEYGIHGSDAADGTNSLERFAPGGVFTANAVVGGNCAYYPSTTVCPRSWPATLPLAADGKPIGADLSRIATLTRGVVLEP